MFDKLFSRRQKYLVSDALEDYRRDFELRGCRSFKTLRYECKMLCERLGSAPVEELSIVVLRRYQADRKAEGRAAATINKELAVLSAALNLAASNEVIASIPKFPRRLASAAPRQGFLEQDDYEAILAALPDWGKPVLMFGWYSGWRRSELLGLTRQEVDLRTLQVRLHPDRSKNKETRVLPLRGFGLEAVERALEVQGVETVFSRPCRGRPRRISRTLWHETWSEATEAAGRSHLLTHDLRRSVVRRLELAGVPRKTAMAWVGHQTESIYRRYCISLERDLGPAADRMLRFLERETVDGKVVDMFPR